MNEEYLFSIIRILFGIIFLIKQILTIKAIEFHWAHVSDSKRKLIKIFLNIQLVFTIFLILGFFTEVSAIIIYLLYVYTFIYSSNYGLEESYFYIMSIFMIISAPNLISLDSIFNTSTNIFELSETNIPVIILIIHVSLTFYSASIEKIDSKIWIKGFGVYYFFLSPHCRNFNLNFFTKRKFLMYFFNYTQMISQFLMLFTLLFFNLNMIIPFYLATLVFVSMLIFFFQFAWLSQCCLLIILTPLFFIFNNLENNLIKLFIVELSYLNIKDFIICIIVSSLLFVAFLVLSIPIRWYENKIYLNKILRIAKIFPRIFLGLVNIRAFTEIHLKNIISFKVYVHSKNKVFEIEKIYNEDGTPNTKNIWYLPTCYMTIATKLLDILIELKKTNKLGNYRKRYLVGFLKYLKKKYNLEDEANIEIKINQCNLPEKYEKDFEKSLNNKMKKALLIKLESFEIIEFNEEVVNLNTGRYLRNNFNLAH